MVTSAQALKKYGDPTKESSMTLWDVPKELEIGVLPKRLYCNKDMILPLTKAFKNLISTGCVKELKTWDDYVMHLSTNCEDCRVKEVPESCLQDYKKHKWH